MINRNSSMSDIILHSKARQYVADMMGHEPSPTSYFWIFLAGGFSVFSIVASFLDAPSSGLMYELLTATPFALLAGGCGYWHGKDKQRAYERAVEAKFHELKRTERQKERSTPTTPPKARTQGNSHSGEILIQDLLEALNSIPPDQSGALVAFVYGWAEHYWNSERIDLLSPSSMIRLEPNLLKDLEVTAFGLQKAGGQDALAASALMVHLATHQCEAFQVGRNKMKAVWNRIAQGAPQAQPFKSSAQSYFRVNDPLRRLGTLPLGFS